MGKSKIDPIIQHKLYNLATPLDKGALWAALEHEIVQPEKNRNNKVLFYFLLGSIVAATLLLYGYSNVSYDQINGYDEVYTTVSQAPTPQPSKAAMPIITEERSNTNKNEPTENTIKQKLNNSREAKLSNKNAIFKETKEQIISKKNTLLPTKPIQEDIQQIKGEAKSTTTQIVAERGQENNQNNLVGIDKANVISERRNQIPIASRLSSSRIDGLQFRQYKTFTLDLKPSKMRRVDCYDYNYTYSPLTVMVYYGPGLNKRWLENKNVGSESDFHFALREENESTLEGHRAGALLKFKLKSGFFIKAGIEVANINERLEYDTTVEEPILIENAITGYKVLADGTEVPCYGDIEGVVVRNKTWLFYNQYRFLDIPVLVGYELRTNRWNIAAEGGVLINQSMQYSDGDSGEGGSTFGLASGEPELNMDYYKSSTGMSLQFGLGLGYNLNKKVTFWLTPSIKHGLGNIGADSYVLSQNFTSANLLFGAELKF